MNFLCCLLKLKNVMSHGKRKDVLPGQHYVGQILMHDLSTVLLYIVFLLTDKSDNDWKTLMCELFPLA
jgi:predicted SprT family Zn-dependent metalloprotease